ncbi:hypothetical protein SCHPADRAFT_881506 [Schizopora paradoxa]|uniref:Trafficking protein particle complex II-specific subunit 65 IgD3 domain-containing protein n=1 Tax=Schizopora paradoxa TaxID=27342 RepID=A0A0H2RDI8_9AGAM|nr:hypothetical protein SCHPADRAFT_881506 [Schizopora paradoxa]
MTEEVFKNCSLDIIVPNSVIELPDVDRSHEGDAWIDRLSDAGERTGAFFDERLSFFLLLRFTENDVEPESATNSPPKLLLSFLSHLQVTIESLYIPSSPDITSPSQASAPLLQINRPGGSARPRLGDIDLKLPMFPPQTPSPVPTTTEVDKRYAFSDGTPLKSFVWGEDNADAMDAFRLIWSERESKWIAVYGIALAVVFVRTNFPDPLLCLTLSITLRDKPVASTQARRALTDLVEAAGSLPSLTESKPPLRASRHDISQSSHGGILEEINLLEGLISDPLKANANSLYLPSTRLPSAVRQAYSLPPLTPSTPIPSASTPSKALPVLRKSFRKTVSTISGFHVRMRTVFIPHIYIPGDSEDGFAGNEAANEESTVVLSVEVQTSDDIETGFAIESVKVAIGGDGAKSRLISWGEKGPSDTTGIFPILMRPAEQYNLLYAVSFLRPAELDLPTGAMMRDSMIFQRSVSILINGRPFQMTDGRALDQENLTYPTIPFLSRWNCILDLTPRRNRDSYHTADNLPTSNNALPFPMSPFPPASPHPSALHDQLSANFLASPQKGPSLHPNQRLDSLPHSRSITPSRPGPSGRLTPLGKLDVKHRPPSFVQSALSPPLPPLPPGGQSTPTASYTGQSYPPNGGTTPRPQSIVPSFGQMATIGMGASASRAHFNAPGQPQTPGPRLLAGERVADEQEGADFVVSVHLIPPEGDASTSSSQQHIHPLDEFSLEIFVFNRSKYPRTLEATYPDKKNSAGQKRTSSNGVREGSSAPVTPGFTPLESRIRIGPLAQSSCQSVRMRFLAILPGIHSIDGLVLTDVETGHATNLRSVLDFAVVPKDNDAS